MGIIDIWKLINRFSQYLGTNLNDSFYIIVFVKVKIDNILPPFTYCKCFKPQLSFKANAASPHTWLCNNKPILYGDRGGEELNVALYAYKNSKWIFHQISSENNQTNFYRKLWILPKAKILETCYLNDILFILPSPDLFQAKRPTFDRGRVSL